jgi:hypothetical protein
MIKERTLDPQKGRKKKEISDKMCRYMEGLSVPQEL